MSKPKKKNNDYYEKQKMMCKTLGIRPPPDNLGLIAKIKWIYKELDKK